jgi:hypothetical protein
LRAIVFHEVAGHPVLNSVSIDKHSLAIAATHFTLAIEQIILSIADKAIIALGANDVLDVDQRVCPGESIVGAGMASRLVGQNGVYTGNGAKDTIDDQVRVISRVITLSPVDEVIADAAVEQVITACAANFIVAILTNRDGSR